MRLLIAALLAIAGLQVPQAGVLEGVVTRGESAQPIEGARVAIWGDGGPDFETRTDANGHYAFEVPQGTYNMEVQADGHISVPNPSSNVRVRVTVDPQERLRHDVRLTPVAAIGGRILNEKREPVSGVDVEVLQLTYDPHGRPVWRGVAVGTTNGDGDYRVDGLSPEDYYVRTKSATLVATYFPGTADPRAAAAVHSRESGETNASFALATESTYSVEGKITQPDLQPTLTPALRVYAIPQDSKIPLDVGNVSGTPVGVAPDGGWSFKVSGLLPGAYDLFAVAIPAQTYRTSPAIDPATGNVVASTPPVVSTTSLPGRVATTTVEVRDSDIKDVALSLDPGVGVTGRIQVADDNGSPVTFTPIVPNDQQLLAGLQVLELTTESKKVQVALSLNRRETFIGGLVNLQPTITGDTFTFSNVPAGTYDVGVRQVGQGNEFYLADVRESARSIFDEGLKVRNAPVDFIEVVVGFNGGAVEGSVTGNRGSPVFVVLAPHPSRRENGALFRTAELTDFSKGFLFTSVAPGLYSIFAFEVTDPSQTVPYRNADFLSLYETQGVPVTVEKGAIVNSVQVPLITR